MNSGLYQLQARWFGAGKVLRNPGAENLRRPIHLHPLYKQPVPDARIPLEGRTFLLPERGGKVVPFQTIVRYHRPARFGVQLVFLDSDVRLGLLLPDAQAISRLLLDVTERSLEDSIEVDVVLRFVELACENVCFNRKEPAL